MSWERDPLLAKSKLFFQRAFDEDRDGPVFGLWCSLGLELLARAAVASVSPTLLAEPDKDQRFLLIALKRGSSNTSPKSIGTIQVLALCRQLFDGFSESDMKTAIALVNRRNDELHTGAAAFDAFPPKFWLSDFYRTCRWLANSLGESLESVLGDEEAEVATRILDEIRVEVRQKVAAQIAAHKRVFEGKSEEERASCAKAAELAGIGLAIQRHHRVKCPARDCTATIQGEPFGAVHISHTEDGIEGRQSVSPRSFSCPGCGLKLNGYAELEVAHLGGTYTRTTLTSPEDYYGLVDLETFDAGEFVDNFLRNRPDYFEEYDNE